MIRLLAVALALAAGDDAAQVKAVQAALAAAEPRLHRCWEQAAASGWEVEGRMPVRVVIGAGGRAERVEVDGTALRRPELSACVRDAFAGASLGSAFAPGDAVELPVEFKAEPNVTVRRDDAKALKVPGAQATARILVDAQTSGPVKASLTWVDVKPTARWAPPCCDSMAVVYVARGRAKVGADTVSVGDVVVYPPGSGVPFFLTSLRTELVVLLTPPGPEQQYRRGEIVNGLRAGAPPPARVISGSAAKYPILDGKGQAVILLDRDQASVTRLDITMGTTVPEHVHADEAELLYFVSGSGEMTVDGQKYPVEPYTAVHVPPGTKHSFTATAGVQAVQFFAPSGPEQRFKGAR